LQSLPHKQAAAIKELRINIKALVTRINTILKDYDAIETIDKVETSKKNSQGVENAFWPRGFGVYLTSGPADVYEKLGLLPVFGAIMQVEDLDTRDKLLSFLDDYRQKRFILQSQFGERSFLVNDVCFQLTNAMVDLQDCAIKHHDNTMKAMDANEAVQKLGVLMLESLFSLLSTKQLLDAEIRLQTETQIETLTSQDPYQEPVFAEVFNILKKKKIRKKK
jgi:hypothetical protein